MRCTGITKAGEQCRLEATHGSYCWSHAPETAEERRRRASKGGRAGGNGRGGGDGMDVIKAELAALSEEVRSGQVGTGVAAILVQIANTKLRALEQERRAYLESTRTYTVAQVRQFSEQVGVSIHRHVHDPVALQRIREDIERLAGVAQ
jgi:hypothetical protein